MGVGFFFIFFAENSCFSLDNKTLSGLDTQGQWKTAGLMIFYSTAYFINEIRFIFIFFAENSCFSLDNKILSGLDTQGQ